MGNACLALTGVMGDKEAEKPGKFVAGDGKHGAAVEKTGGGNGALSIISRPVSAEPKSTRGFSSRKVHKIATRIFHRSRRASKVEATQGITDKYVIERPPIGRGYFGVVRKCVDKQTGEITFFDLVKPFESEEWALEAMNDLALSKSDVITYEMFKSIMTEMLGVSKTNHWTLVTLNILLHDGEISWNYGDRRLAQHPASRVARF